jgi:hypothetical protein
VSVPKLAIVAVLVHWKYNQYVTFVVEESYYRTRAVAGPTGELPIGINGFPAHQWHDYRSEVSTIFTF